MLKNFNHDYENYLSEYWEPWSQKIEQRNLYLKFYKSLINLNRDLDSNLSDDKRINDLSLGIGMLSFTQSGQTYQYPIFTSSLDFSFNKEITMRLFLLQEVCLIGGLNLVDF